MRGIYNKPEKPIIAKRECIQINRRVFLSTRGAASYWARKRIAEKHTMLYEVIKPIGIYSACYALEDIGEIYGMKCTCGRGFDCPIHKRESGYLSRLHKRYARVLRRAFDEQLRMA